MTATLQRPDAQMLPPGTVLHLGVTATRHGLTPAQHYEAQRQLRRLAGGADVVWLHHGDCKGGDEALARWAKASHGWLLHSHPGDDDEMRAYVRSDVVEQPKYPLDRNPDIVAAAEHLVACPRMEVEELRSGTWATVRHAWSVGVPVTLVWPRGWAETHELEPPAGQHWRLRR